MNEPRRSLLPVALGIALTALLLLALAYVARKRNAEISEYPQLTLTQPQTDATVDSPLVMVFSTTRALQLTDAGWNAGSLHLHAWLNGMQYMPAAAEIRVRPDGTYEWTLPSAQRGPDQELHLGWADARHRPLTAGATPPISVTIR